MKIVIVNGSPRKGNTYAATQAFKEEMCQYGEIEFVDYFLPEDLPEFCLGCMTCFLKGEDKCPHAQYTLPILEELLSADGLIFTSPVFVMQTSACMKNFLDHFGHLFLVHRPRPEMFSKKAMIISSTVGAGTGAVIKTISTNLKYWGINRIHSYAFKTFGDDWKDMKPNKKDKILSKIAKKANGFYQDVASQKRHLPYPLTRVMYGVSRILMRKFYEADSLDKKYWKEKGWYSGKKSPFKK